MSLITSVKAIAAGTVFIVIASLFVQLAYLFLAIAYNELARSYPVLNDIREILIVAVIFPLMMLIMFVGGYITAYIARVQVVLHGLVVACLTAFSMLWYAMSYMQLAVTGILVLLLGIVASIVGALQAQKEATRAGDNPEYSQ